MSRADKIIAILLDRNVVTDCANTYGEPGYMDPEKGVLLANWNDVSERLGDYLEAQGYKLEWSDEWTTVDGKAYRTQADSHDWRPTAVVPPEWCEFLVPGHGADEAIQVFASDTAETVGAVPYWVSDDDLLEAGFELHAGDYETGWHPGQTDDPKKIAKTLLAKDGPARRVVFQITDINQFDTHWRVWFEPAAAREDS